MNYKGRKYLIEKIGYENDPVKIKQAFKLGCAGVIVDGTIPESVAAEIALLTPEILTALHPHDQNASLIPPKFKFRLEYGAASKQTNWVGPSATVLRETCLWLEEEATWAVASGLRPAFNQMRSGLGRSKPILMRAWLFNDLVRHWHIDKGEPTPWKDVHVHMQGEGLCIASPSKPTRVRLDDVRELKIYQGSVVQDGMADELLKEKNFSIVQLKPGQKLVFNDRCLHRSSYTQDTQIKLRAAMF